MRTWSVGGALLEGPEGLLLVRNARPTGIIDWSTPGGVIDDDDDSLLHGLEREVLEETGLTVQAWSGHVYSVRAYAPDMDWTMLCEVHLADRYSGSFTFVDPDRIVVGAEFVHPEQCSAYLHGAREWVREPLEAWLAERWAPGDVREFHYTVHGDEPGNFAVERTHP